MMSGTYEISLGSPKRNNKVDVMRRASSIKTLDKKTFYEREVLMRWASHILEKPLDSSDTLDFSDGISLIKLVDKLARTRKTLLVHTTPVLQCQKLDNYKNMLSFLRTQTSVAISPEINAEGFLFGEVDLQYELVWQLVRNYKLRASQDLVLDWVNKLVVQRRVRNLSGDWADGIVLYSFVNSIVKGNNPDCICPKDALPQDLLNSALTTASNGKNIPPILFPQVPVNTYPSSKPLLTYMSLFLSPYISNIKRWLHNILPSKKFGDFHSCWSDGSLLSLLLEKVHPGLCKDLPAGYTHEELPMDLQLKNVREMLSRVKKTLNIKSNLDPNAIVNRTAEPLAIAIFLDDIRRYSLIKRPNRKLLAIQTSDYDTASIDSSTNSVSRTFSEISIGNMPHFSQRRRSKSYDSLNKFCGAVTGLEPQNPGSSFNISQCQPDSISLSLHGDSPFERTSTERMSSISIGRREGNFPSHISTHMTYSLGSYMDGGTTNAKLGVGIREVPLEGSRQSPSQLEENRKLSGHKKRGKRSCCIITFLILLIMLLLLLIGAAASVIVLCTVGRHCVPRS